ncbi:FG-GAP repeat domain-containing protein [Fontivita pretiosa]|uniref:FG-GAP repeat domain-containing protein n=1 Tax=Fontivita pretiosa TaxID=2989684 RepID=UPI003D17BFAB
MLLLAGTSCLNLFTGQTRAGQITDSGLQGFINGQFLDGGSNLYVSAAGRMQIINRWDLNGDGHLDIVMPSGHAHTEKEDTYIYLNNGSDIDGRRRIVLPANGSRDGLVGDFNRDGFTDIAVCNGDNGIHTKTNAYIYYGGPNGFGAIEGNGPGQRTTLPAYSSNAIAAGDFNGDGWTDLAIACQWQAGDPVDPAGPKLSFVYYNGAQGFDPRRRIEFDANEAILAAAAGDVDGDGRCDLVLATGKRLTICLAARNAIEDASARTELPIGARSVAIGNVTGDSHADLVLCSGEQVLVLIGASDGFSPERRFALEAKAPIDVALADFDGDGRTDIAVANHTGADGAPWIRSFVYYSDGGNFASRTRVELPSMGASAVSAGDLDGDGRPELVFSNQRVTNQYCIPSCVYWNRGGSFESTARTELETQGSVGNAIGDLNNDGRPDVVFFNFEGNFRDGASYSTIYFGDGTRNYSPQRSINIQTHYITSVAHADLDDDGRVDLILTQSRFIGGADEQMFNSLIICWGEDPTYRLRTRLTVDNMAGGVRVADLNRDGHLDLIVGAICADESDPQRKAAGLPVFWGSANGFSQRNRTLITPVAEYARVPLLADVNNDGYLDMVTQVEFGSIDFWYGSSQGIATMPGKRLDLGRKDNLVFIDSADLNKDGWVDLILPCRAIGKNAEVSSFVYYGSPAGYSNDRREQLPSKGAYEVSVADLDNDSWLDVFITSYKGNFARNFPSTIYWGSEQGLLKRKPTDIPTLAASGVETADYDGDGWIDLLISNHRLDGSSNRPGPHDHYTHSMLYWGGREGFSPQRRWDFLANGPHAMNVRDVGNGIDRGLYEDYISVARQLPDAQQPLQLQWDAHTPPGTKLAFQIRLAESKDALAGAAWTGPDGAGSWYTQSGTQIAREPRQSGAWIQYRARLSSSNGGPTPYLKSVTIRTGQ